MLAAASQGARYIYISTFTLSSISTPSTYLKYLQEPQPSPIVIELPGETGPEYTCPGDGTFPDMESGCEQYYVCNQGKSWKYTCPPSLLFDAVEGVCNWSQLVDDYCNAQN